MSINLRLTREWQLSQTGPYALAPAKFHPINETPNPSWPRQQEYKQAEKTCAFLKQRAAQIQPQMQAKNLECELGKEAKRVRTLLPKDLKHELGKEAKRVRTLLIIAIREKEQFQNPAARSLPRRSNSIHT